MIQLINYAEKMYYSVMSTTTIALHMNKSESSSSSYKIKRYVRICAQLGIYEIRNSQDMRLI